MKLEDLLKKSLPAGKLTKRTITIKTEDGDKEADVYVKVLSCDEVMSSDAKTNKEALYENVSKAIVNEKGDQIFTAQQVAGLQSYIWFQLLDHSNELNVTGKTKP